jgi:hypothetical protein
LLQGNSPSRHSGVANFLRLQNMGKYITLIRAAY